MKETFNNLPQWAKGVIAVVLVGGAALITYKVYKSLSKTGGEKDAEESLKDTNKDIKELSKIEKPCCIPAQYGAYSDALFEAMHGMGTDEDTILDVFGKMKNTIDVLYLIQAFGIRDYYDDSAFGLNVKPMNLNQWISAELSSGAKKDLNKILSTKGIKFQF